MTIAKPTVVSSAPGELQVAWMLPSGAYLGTVQWRQTSTVWHTEPSAWRSSIIKGLGVGPVDVRVIFEGIGASPILAVTLPAPPPPPPPPKRALRVALINCSQKGDAVDETCFNAGIIWDRIDVGDGSKIRLLDLPHTAGMEALPLYNPGVGRSGGLNNRTPAQVGAEVAALAPLLTARGIKELEVGNEPWFNNRDPAGDQDTGAVVETATTYGAKYAAAKNALAGSGITAIAQVTGSYDVTGHGNWSDDKTAGWIRDFVFSLPPGMKPDAFSAHPYPYNGDPLAVSHQDTGWPALKSWHDISLSLNLDIPWLITETGAKVGQSGGQIAQQTVLQQMLSSLQKADPQIPGSPFDWVSFVAVYTAVDDSPSADWGVLSADGSPRPAFSAVKALANG